MISRSAVAAAGVLGLTFSSATMPAKATEKVDYPEVKVDLAELFKPDPAFTQMRKRMLEAVKQKDQAALLALVGPTFVWTYQGGQVEQFDMGRTAVDNFKVVFGFRQPGADKDGDVEEGPFWDALLEFAEETAHYQVEEAGNLVCGPLMAGYADEEKAEAAREKVETEDDPAEWYFTLEPTPVMKSPNDKGQPMAKVANVAMPVLSGYPVAKEGEPAPKMTHIEVLLPTGKSGWVAKDKVRPLVTSRLCYSKSPSGEWRISAYDQSE